jgi:hypothetical protein
VAHKKRKDEAADVIELPEFDEAEFMRNDIESTKAALWSILYAVPAAGVAYGITVGAGAPVIALGVGILLLFGLRYLLPILRVRTAAFKRRDWLGHAATYFFSFLAFWILLMNPPFGDFTPPEIRAPWVNGVAVANQTVSVNATAWTATTIAVVVGDNGGLQSVTLTIEGVVEAAEMAGAGSNYTYTADLGSRVPRAAEITATDRAGHTTTFPFVIRP